jgi:hypothetical protein
MVYSSSPWSEILESVYGLAMFCSILLSEIHACVDKWDDFRLLSRSKFSIGNQMLSEFLFPRWNAALNTAWPNRSSQNLNGGISRTCSSCYHKVLVRDLDVFFALLLPKLRILFLQERLRHGLPSYMISISTTTIYVLLFSSRCIQDRHKHGWCVIQSNLLE